MCARLVERFHDEHGRAYGYSAPSEPVELVNLRVTALGAIVKPPAGGRMVRARGLQTAPTSVRRVYFAECGGYVDCPIYDRYRMALEAVVDGPAVVEEFDSTTVIHPGYRGRIDTFGNLHLTVGGAEPPAEPRPTA